MRVVAKQVYCFAGIEVDPVRGSLRRGAQELYLRPKTLQVLVYLIEQRHRAVTKEELVHHIWKGTAVTDDALVQCVVDIRKALDDTARGGRFVKTLPKTGYRFIAPVDVRWQQETCRNAEIVYESETAFVEVAIEEDISMAGLSPETGANTKLGRGRKSRLGMTTAQIAVVTFAIAISASAAYYLGGVSWNPNDRRTETSPPEATGQRGLAVMYFDNRSAVPELDWLCEGLADMLITGLSRVSWLNVLGRGQLHALLERSGYLPGQEVEIGVGLDMARRARADVVATGSFARLGSDLRVDVFLHDSVSGKLLAAESVIVDKPEQIFRQIDWLAWKLAGHLGVSLKGRRDSGGLADVMTDNLEAYRFYSLAVEKAHAYHSNEAIELLEKAVAIDPRFAQAYARLGYTYAMVRVGEGERAKPYLERAAQLGDRLNDKDKLYLAVWYAYADNEDREETIDALRRLLAAYPHEVEAYWRLGHLLALQSRTEEAIVAYREGLTVDPQAWNIYNGLGFCYSALGRYKEAIEAHQHYVALAGNEPNAHDSLGITYTEAGRYEEALAEFDRALALQPSFHFANLHKGDAYFRLGRYKAALRQYQGYLETAPSDWDRAQGHYRLALLHWKRGDIKNALAAARQEQKFHRAGWSAFLIALDQGDLNTAEELKTQVFASLPTPKLLAYFRGVYALRTGRAEEAVRLFREVAGRTPMVWNVGGFEDCLADTYLELGRLDDAVTEYRRVLDINPNYPDAHYRVAQAYQQKGSPDEAEVHYRRFLQIWKDADPDIPEVVLAKRQLADLLSRGGSNLKR